MAGLAKDIRTHCGPILCDGKSVGFLSVLVICVAVSVRC